MPGQRYPLSLPQTADFATSDLSTYLLLITGIHNCKHYKHINSTITFSLFDCSLCQYIKIVSALPPSANIGNTLTGKLPTCSLSSLTIDSPSAAPPELPGTVSV